MSTVGKTEPAVVVSCETCLEEVPVSEAMMEEACDYVRHFCGLECYSLWQEKSRAQSG